MIAISKKIKLDIFNLIKNERNIFGDSDQYDILTFLSEIWDLKAMPSTDARFKDAYGDIVQHTINNDDWDIDYLLIDRLQLLEDDEKFILFIETVVHPKFKKDENEIIKFVLLINPYLENQGGKLVINEYLLNGLPVYKVKLKSDIEDLPIDLKVNSIPFFVTLSPNGWSNRASSHAPPSVHPAFVLAFNSGWNDFQISSEFSMFFYNQKNECISIGEVKIISNGDEKNTGEVIQTEFTVLNDNFCSLQQELDNYVKLKNELGKEFESVLYAIKDAAFFADIHDKFERNSKFQTSVLRNDRAERLLRIARYQIHDYDLANLYKFKYIFNPPFSTEPPIDVDFQFDNNNELPNRIYALIGKNGTGKTQLITSIPNNIYHKKSEFFVPRIPLFSKVIAVSYSIFDQFEIPKRTASFNYVYCGLRNEKDEELSDRALILRFHATWKRIETIERIDQWRRILLNFIDQEIIDLFLTLRDDPITRRNKYEVNIEGFHKAKKMLSSGQSIILYIISEIVANIRFDSLLLYDEPETHLHPNAITQLMNTIYELVNEFDSYCIIATHSPMIIRELFSKNVYVIERHENVPSVRRIGMESFGENISTLTEEVFGNKEIPKQYKKIIAELVESGKSFDDIIGLLEFDNVPLSLNARLYIKGLTK